MLAQRRVLSGLLAERRRVALDVEQIVGDLERLTERAAIVVERLILLLRGLAEDRAGNAGIAQPRDVDRLAVAEPALAGKVEHLAARHAADPRGPRERAGQCEAHAGVAVNLVAGDDVEGERQ